MLNREWKSLEEVAPVLWAEAFKTLKGLGDGRDLRLRLSCHLLSKKGPHSVDIPGLEISMQNVIIIFIFGVIALVLLGRGFWMLRTGAR